MHEKNFVCNNQMFLVIAPDAFAGGVDCKSGSQFQYKQSGYDGGAQPRMGMEIERETWINKGKTVGEAVFYYLSGGSTSGVLGTLDQSTKVVTDNSHASDRPTGTIKYTINAKMPTVEGGIAIRKLNCVETFPTVPRP